MAGELVISSPKEFAQRAGEFCQGVTCIYLPTEDIKPQPSDIEKAPAIRGTLEIHKLECDLTSGAINFYTLRNESVSFHRQVYTNSCGHQLKICKEDTCAHCQVMHSNNETVDWLHCPICKLWFHDYCFII